MFCDETDAVIVLKKNGEVWHERSCRHPEHWTPNCIVVGVVYDYEERQQEKVEKLLAFEQNCESIFVRREEMRR